MKEDTKKEAKKDKDKKTLTLFLLIVPSFLLAMTSSIEGVLIRLFFQVVLLLFHIVLFRNLLDDYYGAE